MCILGVWSCAGVAARFRVLPENEIFGCRSDVARTKDEPVHQHPSPYRSPASAAGMRSYNDYKLRFAAASTEPARTHVAFFRLMARCSTGTTRREGVFAPVMNQKTHIVNSRTGCVIGLSTRDREISCTKNIISRRAVISVIRYYI